MPIPASNDKPPAAKHDPQFYMETMFVQVQDTLFQVPKIAFEGRSWSYLADAANTRRAHRRQQSQSPSQSHEEGRVATPEPQELEEGSSEAKPIVVDIDVGDFRGLLHVMYAKSSIIQGYPTTINPDQWSSALRLSTMWKFDDIRQEAITALDPTIPSWDPLRIIILARECKVRKWLIQAYRQLTLVRVDELEPGWFDGEALGWQTLSCLFFIREKYRVGPNGRALVKYLNSDSEVKTGVKVYCWHCKTDRPLGERNTCYNFHHTSDEKSTDDPLLEVVTKAIEDMFEQELHDMSDY